MSQYKGKLTWARGAGVGGGVAGCEGEALAHNHWSLYTGEGEKGMALDNFQTGVTFIRWRKWFMESDQSV